MTNAIRVIVFALIALVSLPSSNAMADWWNPFSSKKSKTTSVSSKNSSQWVPSFMRKSNSRNKKPSAMSKMSRSTQQWWRKTADFLAPFPKETTKSTDTSAYGTFSDSKKKPKKESWMSGLWKTEKEEEIKTIGDWMDLSRPD